MWVWATISINEEAFAPNFEALLQVLVSRVGLSSLTQICVQPPCRANRQWKDNIHQ